MKVKEHNDEHIIASPANRFFFNYPFRWVKTFAPSEMK